jgi:hypothetical protein
MTPSSPEDTRLVSAALVDTDALTNAGLIDRYRRGPGMLRAAVEDLTPEQLRARPFPDKFTSLEVACHILDSDQMLADRMKRTIGLDRPLLVGIDPTPYLVALKYHDRDLALVLDLLALTRRQMAEDLDRQPEDAWSRDAVHTEAGLVTLRQQMLHAIRHLERHTAAIDEKRIALGLKATLSS